MKQGESAQVRLLYPPHTGYILWYEVKAGDVIKKGDPLYPLERLGEINIVRSQFSGTISCVRDTRPTDFVTCDLVVIELLQAMEEIDQENLLKIVAPCILADYYTAPEEGAKPYVTEGSAVKKGDIVALGMVNKMHVEVPSPYDGIVEKIHFINREEKMKDSLLLSIRPNK